MGINVALALQLAEIFSRNQIGGRVLTCGRQEIHFGLSDCAEIMRRFGYSQHAPGATEIAAPPEIAARLRSIVAANQHIGIATPAVQNSWISDKLFFAAFGFIDLKTLDVSDFEGADVLWDLNRPGLGAKLGQTYDLVIDAGTMEHVFDVRTVLRNLFEATAVGGYIVHTSPSNNYMDHGFYQFSPTLFEDYYSANGFRRIVIRVLRHSKDINRDPWFASDYDAGVFSATSFGGLDSAMYDTIVCVQKTPTSTWDRIPTQGRYQTFTPAPPRPVPLG